jgi:hypothetical protein
MPASCIPAPFLGASSSLAYLWHTKFITKLAFSTGNNTCQEMTSDNVSGTGGIGENSTPSAHDNLVGIFHCTKPSCRLWSLWSSNSLCTGGWGGINQWIQINLWDDEVQSKLPKVTQLITAQVLGRREHAPSSPPCCPLCNERNTIAQQLLRLKMHLSSCISYDPVLPTRRSYHNKKKTCITQVANMIY